jgi:hypothetical protein
MKYLYDLLQSGRLDGYKKGNRWSIPRESIQRLLTHRIRGNAKLQSAQTANGVQQTGHRRDGSKPKIVGVERVSRNVSR